MSGPFRQLFVEVPTAILEAAIAEAQSRQPRLADMAHVVKQAFSPASVLSSRRIEASLSRRYGWLGYEHRREALSDAVSLLVTWRCWHRARLTISELALRRARDAESLLDLLDEVVEAAGRPCCCVQGPT